MNRDNLPVVYVIKPVTDVEFDIVTSDTRVPESFTIVDSIINTKLFDTMTMITELLADKGFIVHFEAERVG